MPDTVTLDLPVAEKPATAKPKTRKPKAATPTVHRPRVTEPASKPTVKLQMGVIENLDDVTPAMNAAWRELTNNPMGSPDWLLPWWEHYGTAQDRLQLIVFFVGHELVGVTPLYLENGIDFKMLGSGKVCSDHAELFISKDRWRQSVSSLFLNWLTGSNAPKWRSLQLEAIDSFGPSARMVDQWKDRVSVHHETGDAICSISLPDSWDQYLSSLSKNHRKRVRRWTRQHLDTNQVEVRSTESGWDFEDAFDCLVDLHNLHKDALSRLGPREQATISGIFVDDKPVAIEYELNNEDTVFAYQSGADMDSELSSPGSISILVRLKLAISQGKKTFDLMRGDEGYKQHWGAQCVNTCNVMLWPNTLAGSTAKTKFHLKRKLRSLVKTCIGKRA